MAEVGGIAGEQLKSLIERIERLEEEKRVLGEDIKEVYAEAKGTGFEPKIMRQLIKIRRMDKDEHDEQESLLDLINVRWECCRKAVPEPRQRNNQEAAEESQRSRLVGGAAHPACAKTSVQCRDERVCFSVGGIEAAYEAREARAPAVELKAVRLERVHYHTGQFQKDLVRLDGS